MDEKLRVALSKKLSYLLRHDTNVRRDDGGWVSLNEIRDGRIKRHLVELVDTSEKNRFEFESANNRIRARQGHSVKNVREEELLSPVSTDENGKIHGYLYAVHSTFLSCIPRIQQSGGLSKMKRNHVHMVLAELENIKGLNANGNIPGMRKNANAFLAINLQKAETAGCKFYLSGNNVLLSAGNANGNIPWSCCTLYR